MQTQDPGEPSPADPGFARPSPADAIAGATEHAASAPPHAVAALPPLPQHSRQDSATATTSHRDAPPLAISKLPRPSSSGETQTLMDEKTSSSPQYKRLRTEDYTMAAPSFPARHQAPLDTLNVLDINVRGQIFSVKRKTLCHVPGSLLELMFSGRWDSGLERDSQGRVFLEFNPACFQAVLEVLSHACTLGQQPPLASPLVPSEILPEFLWLVQYLGLQHALQPAVRALGLRFSSTQGHVTLHDRKRMADVPDPTSSPSLPPSELRAHASALAVPLLPPGTSFWKIHIHKLDATYFAGAFFGIMDASPAAPVGYTASCHGWQAAGGVVAQGQLVGDQREFEGFQEGDNVVMRLEPHLGVLSMAVDRLPRVYSLRLRGEPQRPQQRRQVVCMFFTSGNCVELMDPLPHEVDWLAVA